MPHANTNVGTEGMLGGRAQFHALGSEKDETRHSLQKKPAFTWLGPGRPAPHQAAAGCVAVQRLRVGAILVEEALGVGGEAAAAREAGDHFSWEPPGDAAKVQVLPQQLHIFPPGAFWNNLSTHIGMAYRGKAGNLPPLGHLQHTGVSLQEQLHLPPVTNRWWATAV